MLRLKLQTSLQFPLEAPCLAPDRLATLSLSEIERLPVQHGNRQEHLADHFAVTGSAADAAVEIDGDCTRVKWLGAKMQGGSLRVLGHAGMHAGSTMTGGEITIHGTANDWVGAEMRGGLIRVHGDAGRQAGAAYPGSRAGMRGGILLVHGRTEDATGAAMRRGLIVVGGCGDYAGASMVAGSLFVFGSIGLYLGMGMRRGTIVAGGSAPTLLPTFRAACTYQPEFLTIYWQRLIALAYPCQVMPRTWRRYCGDLAEDGRGEILLPARD